MDRMKRLFMILSAATLGMACVSTPAEPTMATATPRAAPPGSSAPHAPTKKWGPPARCGEVAYAHDCPADRHAKFECFVHALEECEPATLRVKMTTSEGGKIVHDFSVTRAADGTCGVEGRYDERGDKFGGKAGVTTSRCKSVKPLEIPGCTTLGMDGC
jgi:hypothetical protein